MALSVESEPAAGLIFEFETDFAGSLRCIPMSVRLKLDQVGVKLSLRQWSCFSREDRDQVLRQSCDTDWQMQQYRQLLTRLIETRANETVSFLASEPHPPWADASRLPPQLIAYVAAQALPALSLPQWAALTPLQRFALLKLSRAAHDNENFLPALREFGLLKG